MLRKTIATLGALVILSTAPWFGSHAVEVPARVDNNKERQTALASLFTQLDANNDGEILEDEAARFVSSCPDCEYDALVSTNIFRNRVVIFLISETQSLDSEHDAFELLREKKKCGAQNLGLLSLLLVYKLKNKGACSEIVTWTSINNQYLC